MHHQVNQSEQHIAGFTFCHDTQTIASFPDLPTVQFLIACSLQKRRENKTIQTVHAAVATASQTWAIFHEQNLCREQAFFLHDSIPGVALSTILLSSLSSQSVMAWVWVTLETQEVGCHVWISVAFAHGLFHGDLLKSGCSPHTLLLLSWTVKCARFWTFNFGKIFDIQLM